MTSRSCVIVTALGITLLTGCLGGSSTTATVAPPASITLGNGETYQTASLTGAGTAANPFRMPTEAPGGMTADMSDYFTADASAYKWEVAIRGVAASYSTQFSSLVYDPATDSFTVDVTYAGTTTSHTLLNPDGDQYYDDCGGAYCWSLSKFVEIGVFDAATASPTGRDYGTFASLYFRDDTIPKRAFHYAHTGLATPTTALPAGSATYTGVLQGSTALSGATYELLDNASTVLADFGAGTIGLSAGGTVLVDDGSGTPIPGTTFVVTGTATISGNTFSGTSAIDVTDSLGTVSLAGGAGTLDGGFYGPAAEQLAGSLHVSGTDYLLAGFWGERP